MFSCFQSTVPQDIELVLDITPKQHAQTSSNLTIIAYTDINKRYVLPCIFKWTRLIDQSIIQLKEVKGNSYQCQPDDLGSIIQCEIVCRNADKPGKTVVTFGPIQMDLTLKPNMQNILVCDLCRQIVKISDYGQTKQCYLSISSKSIQIFDLNSNLLLEVDYFVDSPVFKINLNNSNKVSIIFALPTYRPLKQFYDSLFKRPTAFEGKSIDITFVNRISRDTFIFSHKVLSAKKDIKVTQLLMAIEQRNRLKNLLNIDSLLIIQYLRRDLKRYIKLYGQQKKQKQICLIQVNKLQQQISVVRNSYTKYISDCLKQIHPHTQNSLIEELDQKHFQYNFQEENKLLKFRIIKMNEQIKMMQVVHKKKIQKRIVRSDLSQSQISLQKLVNSMEEQYNNQGMIQKIKVLEQQNIQMSKRIAQILADYQDLKYQKQLLLKQQLNMSIRSNQSQQAVSTINKLIGDIVELKKINNQLLIENQRLTGKKIQSNLAIEDTQVDILESKLKQTQRLLQVSQQSYQRMKQMFQKTQVKYDTPRSSSYNSSVSSVSTGGKRKAKKKVQTPKRKQSVHSVKKNKLECV